jgi:hypothetical protein
MERETVHLCYSLRSTFNDEERKSFGNAIAEPLIFADYVRCTRGNPIGPGETDWWDEGPLPIRVSRYIEVLNRRHDIKKLHLEAWARSGKGALRIPDILTFRGKQVTPAGPAALATRHEFYEIKPRSESGIRDGLSKIKSIEETFVYCNAFLGAKNLRYQKGITYPTQKEWPSGIVRLPLLKLRWGHQKSWQRALDVAMRRFGISQVDVYLEVRRPQPALLAYRLCVRFQVEDTDENAEQIGRDLVYACVTCATAFMLPEEERETVLRVARGIEVVGFERGGVDKWYLGKFQSQRIRPLLVVGVKVLRLTPQFQPCLDSVSAVINSRGVGLPHEKYILCVDEEFYFSVLLPLSEDPVLRVQRMTPTEWVTLIEDRLTTAGAVGAVIQARAQGLEASGWAIKTLVNFAKEHPGESAVYLGLIVLATALLCVAAGAGVAAVAEGAEAAEASTQMLPRTIFREYQRLELGAAESELARVNAIANAASPPMSGGAAESIEALQAVMPRTALSSVLRSQIVSKSARLSLAAGTGLTLALGAHTASAQGRTDADGKQGAAASPDGALVNFTGLFALRPYTREEWTAGKYPDPNELRLGERFQSRYSPDDTKGGHYRYVGMIQLT